MDVGSIRDSLEELVGASPVMLAVYDRIEKAAATDVTVLITGESGTGKELAARAIHRLSRRREGPFISVNAGAIPRELVASELFGHEPGAFTGAAYRRPGKFELADGGTLFLDEIAATDHNTQIALLRSLEDRWITRLGGQHPVHVDARFIAATNESLSRAIRAGRFRKDLFFRLDIFQIRMPPLRDRGGDLMLLADRFLREIASDLGRKIDGFTDEARTCLLGYSWPGNVRELKNCVYRAVVASEGRAIRREDLPRRLRTIVHATREIRLKLGRRLGDIERAYVLRTLEECRGNKMEAARLLGISRKALYDKLARWEKEDGDGDVYSLGKEETVPIRPSPREEE